ncbi:hypothetical protein BCh11DRAFT_06709 [Burkholderia sp. Ch1-1]|uniref:Putative anti-sigma-F factor NrsF n=1 Tax=Paraburkholderia dioscoreae TaxID=2604047 RepID=A0A5Q4Z229_9BURK|nr:DUF1109 domain-containing protein [Paraburkholderia dioscoreae]EIF31193.1 hypothetical protein BCh11DRAFT_06709 [Burkholderia sp. Ch1-1]VVD28606.1 putative anti-sigma-F factor NrsF [Paraburkholderia dioscoreae]
MKTDDFISLLATGVAPVDRYALTKRFGVAMLAGAAGATLIMALVLGIRRDLAQVAVTPIFWAKIALPLCVMIGSLWMSTRLARPGLRTGGSGWLIAAPVAAVWLAGAYVLMAAPGDARLALVLGKTWRVCPFNIAMLSIPGFVAVFWALKGLAPTRLVLTGAVGGLLAGSIATLAYCLHCPEMGIPFWGVWYVLGMLLPAIVGALLGPRLLRW